LRERDSAHSGVAKRKRIKTKETCINQKRHTKETYFLSRNVCFRKRDGAPSGVAKRKRIEET